MDTPVYLAPDFEHLLEVYAIEPIHLSDNTIYGIRPDFTLAYLNRGWERFAVLNGGEPSISTDWKLGRCVLDAIPQTLRSFYWDNFAKCLDESRPWTNYYQCPSAETDREMCMTAFPLGEKEGLLVVHSLVREMIQTQRRCEPLNSVYRHEFGYIHQCSNCRRVQRSDADDAWDWVPDWVRSSPENVIHGICEPCLGFHKAKSNAVSARFPREFRKN